MNNKNNISKKSQKLLIDKYKNEIDRLKRDLSKSHKILSKNRLFIIGIIYLTVIYAIYLISLFFIIEYSNYVLLINLISTICIVALLLVIFFKEDPLNNELKSNQINNLLLIAKEGIIKRENYEYIYTMINNEPFLLLKHNSSKNKDITEDIELSKDILYYFDDFGYGIRLINYALIEKINQESLGNLYKEDINFLIENISNILNIKFNLIDNIKIIAPHEGNIELLIINDKYIKSLDISPENWDMLFFLLCPIYSCILYFLVKKTKHQIIVKSLIFDDGNNSVKLELLMGEKI